MIAFRNRPKDGKHRRRRIGAAQVVRVVGRFLKGGQFSDSAAFQERASVGCLDNDAVVLHRGRYWHRVSRHDSWIYFHEIYVEDV